MLEAGLVVALIMTVLVLPAPRQPPYFSSQAIMMFRRRIADILTMVILLL